MAPQIRTNPISELQDPFSHALNLRLYHVHDLRRRQRIFIDNVYFVVGNTMSTKIPVTPTKILSKNSAFDIEKTNKN